MERLTDVNMGIYTSFRTGGNADCMLIPDTPEELAEALREIRKSGSPFVMLGNGSNTLFREGGFHGTVLKLGPSFGEIRREGNELVVGAAALMSQAANAALEAGLAGFENLCGIPGSLGGAVFMDAGAYGSEMKDVTVSADVVTADGDALRTVPVEEMDLSYRHSIFEETGDIVTSVRIRLTPDDPEKIRRRMKEMLEKRSSKQPLQYPSAGSFFKRPAGHFAGKLIQDAGLRGARVGGAQVSEKHCGFVINRGGATPRDIIDLMHLVQNTVFDQTGILLEPEVRIIGEPEE